MPTYLPSFQCNTWQLTCLFLGEMNAHLSERFKNTPRTHNADSLGHRSSGPNMTLNTNIRKYVADADKPSSAAWLNKREIPTGKEISGIGNGDDDDDEGEFIANQIKNKWPSKQMYLSAHYALLREDSTALLREAVEAFQENPRMRDNTDVSVYEKVCFILPLNMPCLTRVLGTYHRFHFCTSRYCGETPILP